VAKNFSSDVRLVDPSRNVDRNVRIWMNNPLRYAGETFFQADWNKQTERGTVLQIVRNPAWSMPYLACAIGAVGLAIHFGITLINFLRKRNASAMAQATADATSSGGNRPRRGKAQRGTSELPAGIPLGSRVPWFSRATIGALLFILFIYAFTRRATALR
jgi:hypothetical protein